MNGRPGDDPVLDITTHRLTVYGPEADQLIRDIVRCGGERKLRDDSANLLPRKPPAGAQLAQLTQRLRDLRDQLVTEAKERGWEIDT